MSLCRASTSRLIRSNIWNLLTFTSKTKERISNNSQVVTMQEVVTVEWIFLICLAEVDQWRSQLSNQNKQCHLNSSNSSKTTILVASVLVMLQLVNRSKTRETTIKMHLEHQTMIRCFSLKPFSKHRSKKKLISNSNNSSHKWINLELIWWECKAVPVDLEVQVAQEALEDLINSKLAWILWEMDFTRVHNLKCNQWVAIKTWVAFLINSRLECHKPCHNNKWTIIRWEVLRTICMVEEYHHPIWVATVEAWTKCQSSLERSKTSKNSKHKRVTFLDWCPWIPLSSISVFKITQVVLQVCNHQPEVTTRSIISAILHQVQQVAHPACKIHLRINSITTTKTIKATVISVTFSIWRVVARTGSKILSKTKTLGRRWRLMDIIQLIYHQCRNQSNSHQLVHRKISQMRWRCHLCSSQLQLKQHLLNLHLLRAIILLIWWEVASQHSRNLNHNLKLLILNNQNQEKSMTYSHSSISRTNHQNQLQHHHSLLKLQQLIHLPKCSNNNHKLKLKSQKKIMIHSLTLATLLEQVIQFNLQMITQKQIMMMVVLILEIQELTLATISLAISQVG